MRFAVMKFKRDMLVCAGKREFIALERDKLVRKTLNGKKWKWNEN
jgi:hypothetical protein